MAFVEKLKSARHYKSEVPAFDQSYGATRLGFFNSLGVEPRDCSGLATGQPDKLFGLLAHFKFGEVIWVDPWTNFSVKMPGTNNLASSLDWKLYILHNTNFPSGTFPVPLTTIPRRQAINIAIDAVRASGGCFIKAGPNRSLVVKTSEKKQYEAALRYLGWLDGKSPPWTTNSY